MWGCGSGGGGFKSRAVFAWLAQKWVGGGGRRGREGDVAAGLGGHMGSFWKYVCLWGGGGGGGGAHHPLGQGYRV